MNTYEQIREYFFANKEMIVQDTVTLVKARSTSNRKDLSENCADVLLDLVKTRLGIAPEEIHYPENHGRHLFYRVGSGRPKALLLGHYDTVWEPDSEPPLVLEGNRLSGPGTCDMKYGVIAAIWVVKALKELGLLDFSVGMLFNSDEEVSSSTSRPHIERLAGQFENVMVLECASGRAVKTARKTLGRYTIRVEGVAAHAGTDYTKGRSAILEAAYLTQKLFAMTDLEKGTTVNVGMIEGGTKSNVVAAQAVLQIDLRAVTNAEARRTHDAIFGLQPTLDGVKLEITGGITRPPFEFTDANKGLFAVARETAAEIGFALEGVMVGGGSDGNFTSSLGIPTLDGLGAVGDGAHAWHEHILIDESLEHSAFLTAILEKL